MTKPNPIMVSKARNARLVAEMRKPTYTTRTGQVKTAKS